jgi:hypothetical protein
MVRRRREESYHNFPPLDAFNYGYSPVIVVAWTFLISMLPVIVVLVTRPTDAISGTRSMHVYRFLLVEAVA